jgi:SulP family sulfate permease
VGSPATGRCSAVTGAVVRSALKWRTEILAAMVVAVALIPEAISFSVIAHVNPSVGLFASFTMAVTIAIVGGRPAMISAATGSTALVLAPLSQAHGLRYLVAAVLVQVVLGLLGIAKLMRYVPRSVSVGFVNALGILLFKAQFPNLEHVPAVVYALVLAGLLIIGFFPRVNRVIPAPLVAIAVLTILTVGGHMGAVPTVGEQGVLPHNLPVPGRPDVPLSLHTLSLIAGPAVTMAIVGLLETQMTARLVDDLTDTGSDKHRESWGQGIANLVTGDLRRHGRLRDDRPDDDQREIRRANTGLDVARRRVPADPGRRPQPDRVQNPNGRARRGDVRRRLQHV